MDFQKINENVAQVDLELDNEYNSNSYSDRYFSLLDQRGIIYSEFLMIYDNRIQEEEMLENRAFQFLNISTEYGYFSSSQFINGRFDFCEKYEKSKGGFSEALHDLTGNRFFSSVRVNIPVGSLKKHTQIIGKTGEGKSNAIKLLIHSLQQYDNYSIILLDPHGDIGKEVKNSHLNKDSDRLIYVAPKFRNGYTPVINPFEIKDKKLVGKATEFLVEAFDELMKDQNLSDQMRTILTPCIYTLLSNGGYSLSDLQKFMLDDIEMLELGRYSTQSMHADFFKNKFTDKNYARTKLAIYTRIQNLLNHSEFYNMTIGKSTIDLRSAMNSNKVIVFDLSGLGGISKEAFGRFMLAQIKAIAEDRERQKPEYRKSTFLFIDECQNYITSTIEKTLAEMRKYGLHLILAHQYVEQLREMQSAVLSNTDVKIVFKNHKKTLSQFNSYMGLSLEEMSNNWKKYECWIKAGDKRSIKVKFSDKLIKNDSMYLTPTEEKELDEKQLDKYYTKIKTQKQEEKKSAPDTIINLEDEDF